MEPIRVLQKTKYFKLENNKWTPSDEKDTKSKKINLYEINENEINFPKINVNNFTKILLTFKSSIKQEDILKQEEFFNLYGNS
jgi:hypothetical protein